MKQNHKANINSKYLTNSSHGFISEKDFYSLDYTNTGKYKTGVSLLNSQVSTKTANFFNSQQN